MKKSFSFSLLSLLFLSLFPILSYNSQGSHIVINEVELNPPGNDNYKSVIEWIELYNPTSASIDISGWTVSSTHGAKTKTIRISSKVLKPGEYYVIGSSSQWLDNKDERVVLRDSSGRVVDTTPFLSDQENNGLSWSRYPNGRDTDSSSDWRFQSSTKGYSNGGDKQPQSPTPTLTRKHLQNYEVTYPKQVRQGETFTIEIYIETGYYAIYNLIVTVKCPILEDSAMYFHKDFLRSGGYVGYEEGQVAFKGITRVREDASVGFHDLEVYISWGGYDERTQKYVNYLDDLTEIFTVSVIAGPRSSNMIKLFMTQNYYIIAPAQPDKKAAQMLVPDRKILSSPKYAEFNLYLGGPFANPHVKSVCMKLGVIFSRDSMFINGTQYKSIWGLKDYCLIYFSGMNLYIMGTHRYGTKGGLKYVRDIAPSGTLFLICWTDENENGLVEIEELEEIELP